MSDNHIEDESISGGSSENEGSSGYSYINSSSTEEARSSGGEPETAETIFYVKKIRKKRKNKKGEVEYFVHWHGYPRDEDSWIPPGNFTHPDTVKLFEAKVEKYKASKKKRKEGSDRKKKLTKTMKKKAREEEPQQCTSRKNRAQYATEKLTLPTNNRGRKRTRRNCKRRKEPRQPFTSKSRSAHETNNQSLPKKNEGINRTRSEGRDSGTKNDESLLFIQRPNTDSSCNRGNTETVTEPHGDTENSTSNRDYGEEIVSQSSTARKWSIPTPQQSPTFTKSSDIDVTDNQLFESASQYLMELTTRRSNSDEGPIMDTSEAIDHSAFINFYHNIDTSEEESLGEGDKMQVEHCDDDAILLAPEQFEKYFQNW